MSLTGERIGSIIGGSIGSIFLVLHAVMGIVQFFATIAGLHEWLGFHWILVGILSALLAWLPLVGSIIGMFGAVSAWGWSWLAAFALFFGWMIVPLIIAVAIAVGERLTNRA